MVLDSNWNYPRLALYGFTLIVVLTLFIAGTTSGVAFGTFNPGWDGASSLQSLADETDTDNDILQNASRYSNLESNRTVAFVLSPSDSYTDAEAAEIRRFVNDGGTLLVAADFGSESNDLLSMVGANASVDGRLVRDERNYANSPVMPAANNVRNHTYTDGVGRLTLNYGSIVRTNSNNVTVLMNTSSYSYLDTNRNDELDDNETLASYPVATTESVGKGHVIVVSDPSIFINAMLDKPDNKQFARNIVVAHDRAIFDVSHVDGIPPVTRGLLFVRDSWLAQILFGLGGLILIIRWSSLQAILGSLWSSNQPAEQEPANVDPDVVTKRLRERYPEWDEARLQRVTQGIMAAEKERRSNE